MEDEIKNTDIEIILEKQEEELTWRFLESQLKDKRWNNKNFVDGVEFVMAHLLDIRENIEDTMLG